MWGKLLIERAQLITQFESEVDDYPEHVCCSCECLYQRKSVPCVNGFWVTGPSLNRSFTSTDRQ